MGNEVQSHRLVTPYQRCELHLPSALRQNRSSDVLATRTYVTMSNAEKVISYDDLKALLEKSSSLLVIDVRSKEEVDNGNIPGSIHMPVDTVDSDMALDPSAFQAKFGIQKPPLDAPELVFHCQMGRRGGLATEKARALGFQKARNFAGGYKEWSEKEGK